MQARLFRPLPLNFRFGALWSRDRFAVKPEMRSEVVALSFGIRSDSTAVGYRVKAQHYSAIAFLTKGAVGSKHNPTYVTIGAFPSSDKFAFGSFAVVPIGLAFEPFELVVKLLACHGISINVTFIEFWIVDCRRVQPRKLPTFERMSLMFIAHDLLDSLDDIWEVGSDILFLGDIRTQIVELDLPLQTVDSIAFPLSKVNRLLFGSMVILPIKMFSRFLFVGLVAKRWKNRNAIHLFGHCNPASVRDRWHQIILRCPLVGL